MNSEGGCIRRLEVIIEGQRWICVSQTKRYVMRLWSWEGSALSQAFCRDERRVRREADVLIKVFVEKPTSSLLLPKVTCFDRDILIPMQTMLGEVNRMIQKRGIWDGEKAIIY